MGCSVRKDQQKSQRNIKTIQSVCQQPSPETNVPVQNLEILVTKERIHHKGMILYQDLQFVESLIVTDRQDGNSQSFKNNQEGVKVKENIFLKEESTSTYQAVLSNHSSPEKDRNIEKNSNLKGVFRSTILDPEKIKKRVTFAQDKYYHSHLLGKKQSKRKITLEQLERIF